MKCMYVLGITLLLGGFLCQSGIALAAAGPASPASNSPAQGKLPVEDPNKPETIVVARIGDYTITKAQLKQRLIQEVAPQDEMEGEPNHVVTAQGVLDKMVAEKAMAMEGRSLGHLNDKDIHSYLQRVLQQNLIGRMLGDYVRDNVVITDAEVQQQQKADPNLTPERARQKVQTEKVNALLDKFYAGLLTKYKVQKIKENFAKAAQIHQRLLTQPVKPRDQNATWIVPDQIENELTPQEKDLVLATYDGGRLTLADWFWAINDLAPPRRSKDLGTAAGAEAFADVTLQGPILMAEAIARGYDKNEKHMEYMRTVEDNILMNKVLGDKLRDPREPNDAQVKAYFAENPARFGVSASVKIDEIWCKDMATAQKIKEKLGGGAAFDAVKNEYSLRKEETAHDVGPASEGVFWADLAKGEPNTIVGPVKGFYDPRIKWRVVKILEKKPAVAAPYADSMKDRVKMAIMTDRTWTARLRFEKEMLAKYPHEVYAEKIKGIDPLEVPADDTPAR